MRVTIDRARCGHHPRACEDCFSGFLQTGDLPLGGCVVEMIDNGEPEMVVKFILGDQTGTLVVTRNNRERVIYDGWMKFVRLRPSTEDRASGDMRGKD
jgi:hypothetical protein